MNIFNKQITILNRFENGTYEDEFYSTAINGVAMQIHSNSNNNNGKDSDNNSICKLFIRKNILTKQYITPKSWISSDDKSLYVTFKPGDYIVNGNITGIITDIDMLYDQYNDVFKIDSVAYFDLLNSFQVVAS